MDGPNTQYDKVRGYMVRDNKAHIGLCEDDTEDDIGPDRSYDRPYDRPPDNRHIETDKWDAAQRRGWHNLPWEFRHTGSPRQRFPLPWADRAMLLFIMVAHGAGFVLLLISMARGVMRFFE